MSARLFPELRFVVLRGTAVVTHGAILAGKPERTILVREAPRGFTVYAVDLFRDSTGEPLPSGLTPIATGFPTAAAARSFARRLRAWLIAEASPFTPPELPKGSKAGALFRVTGV